MKKNSKVLCIALISIVILFSGCNWNSTEPYYSETSNTNKKDYDICIYNSKRGITDSFQKLCNEYYSETGVKIKVISPAKNDDNFKKLDSMLNSYEHPTIFTISNLYELSQLQQNGFVANLDNLGEDDFKKLIKNIPNNMKLSLKDSGNYGLPYGLDGYGYIVDSEMVASVFGENNVKNFISDLKKSSYDEFEDLVNSLDNFIKYNKSSTVLLNKNSYPIASHKDSVSGNLTGVFSVDTSDEQTYINHIINIAINTTFKSSLNAFNANSSQIDSLSEPFRKYAQALDLNTSHTAGQNTPLNRSKDYIDSELSNYTQSIKTFSEGKSFFINQGNWSYNDIENTNPTLASRLSIVPIKLPLSENDIQLQDTNVEKINCSIPVYVSKYYAINAKVSYKEKKLAQDFLVWLNTSEIGQKYITDEFKFIQYNFDDSFVSNYSLNKSIIEYIKDGNILSGAYTGSPYCNKTSELGEKIKNDYLTKDEWNNDDYNDISKYAIDEWKK